MKRRRSLLSILFKSKHTFYAYLLTWILSGNISNAWLMTYLLMMMMQTCFLLWYCWNCALLQVKNHSRSWLSDGFKSYHDPSRDLKSLILRFVETNTGDNDKTVSRWNWKFNIEKFVQHSLTDIMVLGVETKPPDLSLLVYQVSAENEITRDKQGEANNCFQCLISHQPGSKSEKYFPVGSTYWTLLLQAMICQICFVLYKNSWNHSSKIVPLLIMTKLFKSQGQNCFASRERELTYSRMISYYNPVFPSEVIFRSYLKK